MLFNNRRVDFRDVQDLETRIVSITPDRRDPSMLVITTANDQSIILSKSYCRSPVDLAHVLEEHDLVVRIDADETRAMLAAVGIDVSRWRGELRRGRWGECLDSVP
jgi:hypothetical protein